MSQEAFFAYARARYEIMLAKEAGRPRPWTDDWILRDFRFCNVFREDDTVTKWIRQRLTKEAYGGKLLGALVIARWFNRISTLERLLPPDDCGTPYFPHNLLFSWSEDLLEWKYQMRNRLMGLNPLVTGAYMIKTPPKMDKLNGLIWCLEHILPDAEHLQANIFPEETTLEGVHEVLQGYPYLGSFMSYEVVTDLRHSLLSTAPDIMTWTAPGPGAARGLGRVLSGEVDRFNYHRASDAEEMLEAMRELLELSNDPDYWPAEWPRWEMREVEHTLCEFDKYERARLGEGTPKQRYQGGA